MKKANRDHWPVGYEPVRMDVLSADSPGVVARPHGTVRVFNHPMEGQVILDVAQPLDVSGATRSICYLSPADAGALGGELIGAAMDAERYAREGCR